MWLGYPAGTHSMSLQSAGMQYLEVTLDKTVRGKIITSGLTDEVIQYSANDVKYLELIMNKQKEEIAKKDLENAIKVENAFVLPLAYCEYCGIKLDVNRWKSKMFKDNSREEEALQKCNQWVVDLYKKNQSDLQYWITEDFTFSIKEDYSKKEEHSDPPGKYEMVGPLKREYIPGNGGMSVGYYRTHALIRRPFGFVTINPQGDLFSGFDLEPKCNINWNSAKQVITLFKYLGINTTTFDKVTKSEKDSVDAKVLKPQKDKCSLIPLYLEYREAVKNTSTYGENFLKQVNPVSRRIHTNYQQLGADTTRITSGGKDKEGHIEYVNLLNLPANAETRACFVAEKGNRWLSLDYSGQESALLASIANDPLMLKELNEGNGDIHSLVASLMFEELKDIPLSEIKSKYKPLRQLAKGYEFLIAYGGDYNTMMANFGLPMNEAKEKYHRYMDGLTGVKQYQDFRRNDWTEKGYILLNEYTKHKAFIYDYDQLKEDYRWMQEELDWDYYRELKKEYPSSDTVQRVSRFLKRRSASDKQSINYPMG